MSSGRKDSVAAEYNPDDYCEHDIHICDYCEDCEDEEKSK
jgi:hypothetical protein